MRLKQNAVTKVSTNKSVTRQFSPLGVESSKRQDTPLSSSVNRNRLVETHQMTDGKLPIIDLSPWSSPSPDEKAKQVAAEQLRAAAREYGFFYVQSGPGQSEQAKAGALKAAKAFFDLPSEQKQELAATNSPLYRGYQHCGSYSHTCTPTEAAGPDQKESFTVGATGSDSTMHGDNQWPSASTNSQIREPLEHYWDEMLKLARSVAKALALALELPEDFFVKEMDNPVAQMVLLRYPPPQGDQENLGCGAHTDCGFLTLLTQEDGVEGLEVLDGKSGEWIDAPPLPNCILCNLGDMAQQWSNDFFLSTRHRVVMSGEKTRHSIPFFCNLNFDANVDPATSVCQTPNGAVYGEPKHRPVTAGNYICQKLGLMHLCREVQN